MKYIDKKEFDNAFNEIKDFVADHAENVKPKTLAHILNCLRTIETRSENLVDEERLYGELLKSYSAYWNAIHIIERKLGLTISIETVLDNETKSNVTKFYVCTKEGAQIAEITEDEYKQMAESSFQKAPDEHIIKDNKLHGKKGDKVC